MPIFPPFRRWLLAGLLFVLPKLAPAAATPIVPATDPAELHQRITQILKAHHVPGMSGVVANRDGMLWVAGIGLADVATGKAVTEDTLFRIGSISKTFVGLAALKLVEEGRLNLDTPVRKLVPEVAFSNPWESTDPVRVVHLLEHTTGWDDLHLKEYAHNDPTPATLAAGLAVGPESRTCRWRPGTRYAYCNSGPAVMAAILEKITGQRFEDYIEKTFFQPIGMPTASYFLSRRTQALLTNLYKEDGRTPYLYWHLIMRPAGAINASARDMGAYLRFFLRRGEGANGRILTEASLLRMETPTSSWSAQGGLKTGYGLHNESTLDDRGFRWRGHTGAVDGGLADLAYLPQGGVGYFFSINAGEGEAFEEIRDQLQAFATKDLPRPALPPVQPVPVEMVNAYSGWYHPISPRMQAMAFLEQIGNVGHLTFQDGRLRFQSPFGPSFEVLHVGGGQFRAEKQGAARVILLDSEAGRLMVTSRGTNAKTNAALAWVQIVLTYGFLLSLVSVLLFAVVWAPRWVFRRLRGVPSLHVRALPFLAALSLLAVPMLFSFAGEDAITRMGHRTLWSMGVTLATCAFAGFSAASLWAVLRVRRQDMNRVIYVHSLVASLLFAIATLYLAFWGCIGFRTWA